MAPLTMALLVIPGTRIYMGDRVQEGCGRAVGHLPSPCPVFQPNPGSPRHSGLARELDSHIFLSHLPPPSALRRAGVPHIPARPRTLDFRAPFLPPVFLATGFFWDGDLAFLAGGGVMMASNLPLDPRFFASSSGWIFGNTPPLAMVTPFSSLQENQSHRW